jgi:hypothetical protein
MPTPIPQLYIIFGDYILQKYSIFGDYVEKKPFFGSPETV